jgi:hypothetical protein
LSLLVFNKKIPKNTAKVTVDSLFGCLAPLKERSPFTPEKYYPQVSKILGAVFISQPFY